MDNNKSFSQSALTEEEMSKSQGEVSGKHLQVFNKLNKSSEGQDVAEGAEDLNIQFIQNTNRKGRIKRSIMKCTLIVSIIFILFGIGAACLFRNPTIFMYPLHASCNITYTFQEDCNGVANKLVKQIEVWNTNETCGEGQKCLYSLVSVNGNELKLTHTTPVRKYIDDMLYQFYPNKITSGCNVIGFSTSRLWYALLDYGTNYCNLHNLVDGAGLQNDSQYSELTRDEICTQYTSSNCDKY